jgi:hypothetical protein
MTIDESDRINAKLDVLAGSQATILETVQKIQEHAAVCTAMVNSHHQTLHGNGRSGLVAQVAGLASGRVDTVSIKAVIALVTTVGAVIGSAVGAAIAAFAP